MKADVHQADATTTTGTLNVDDYWRYINS